ncbi:MAG: radical SAM protein [Vampirovibrionales bacterium]|nr:radical SAM protein [Vampirovibrionales bacterium]
MQPLYTPILPTVARPMRFALACPGDRRIALSALGYQTLFKLLDTHEAVDAIQLDLDNAASAPAALDLIGVSFPFELDILNIFKLFESMGKDPLASNRPDELWFAGGPVPTSNPEPFVDFFDFFLIGDGEPAFEALIALWQSPGFAALSKAQKLAEIARSVPGAYVPSLVKVAYEPYELAVTQLRPQEADLAFPVQKASVPPGQMNAYLATSAWVSPESYFPDTYLVEVQRGCAHRCRFCLASYTTLPAQGASLAQLQSAITQGLRYSHKIGLLGALVADHPDFEALCDWLMLQMQQNPEIKLSVASLRADTLTPKIAATMAQGGQKQLTIAIESGAEGLRARINKHLKTEAIFAAAEAALAGGIAGLKLYTMAGLPTEIDADIDATAELIKALKKAFPRLKLTLGCSTFVPKAQTPFQWQARLDTATLKRRLERLRKQTARFAECHFSSPRWDFLQALLARGDRRLGPVLWQWYLAGGGPSALKQCWKAQQKALQLPSMEAMACDARPTSALLPWSMISLGVSPKVLAQEAELSLSKA